MWTYKDGELYHWSLKDFKPKYIAKVPVGGGKYRYFYTQSSYQAYLNKSKQSKNTPSGNLLSNLANKVKNTVSDAVDNVKDSIQEAKTKSTAKKAAEANILANAKATVNNLLQKVGNTKISEVTNKQPNRNNKLLKAKNAVSDVIDKVGEIAANKFKYVAKVKQPNGKYRYFYTQREYQNYLDKQDDKVKKQQEQDDKHDLEDFRRESTPKVVKQMLYKKDQDKERSEVRMSELRDQRNKLAKNNPLPKLDIKKTPYTLDEDMAAVNPNYDPDSLNWSTNCSLCSLTYDLRRRGYDVEAKPAYVAAPGGTTASMQETWYEGAEFRYFNDIAKDNKDVAKWTTDVASDYLEKELKQNGDGSRGILNLTWANGGGHSVIWEVENGEVVVKDTQLNRKVKIEDYVSMSKNFTYLRTDNLTPTEDCLRYVMNTSTEYTTTKKEK